MYYFYDLSVTIYFQLVYQPYAGELLVVSPTAVYIMVPTIPLFCVHDVAWMIKYLNGKSASGIGDSSSFIVKCLSDSAPIVADILCLRIKQGYFLKIWKKASVTRIPKRKKNYNTENFRPISVAECFAKDFRNVGLQGL